MSLELDDLLRFDVVGHLAFLVHPAHEEAGPSPEAAPSRDERVRHLLIAIQSAVMTLKDCQMTQNDDEDVGRTNQILGYSHPCMMGRTNLASSG